MNEAKNDANTEVAGLNERLVIRTGTTVADVVEWLQRKDPAQKFMPQAIAPEGEAWNVPAMIFSVPQSNCGNNLPYLGVQMRCKAGGL